MRDKLVITLESDRKGGLFLDIGGETYTVTPSVDDEGTYTYTMVEQVKPEVSATAKLRVSTHERFDHLTRILDSVAVQAIGTCLTSARLLHGAQVHRERRARREAARQEVADV